MSMSPGVILGAVLVLQAGAMALMWSANPLDWSAPQPQAPAADVIQPLQVHAPQPEPAAYAVQVERPLFVPGRKPVLADAVPAVADEPKDTQILGIFGANGAEGGVIVRVANEVKRVGVGQKLGAMTLLRLDGMEAVFLNGAREQRLKIKALPREAAPAQVQPAGQRKQQPGVPTQRQVLPVPAPPFNAVNADAESEAPTPPATQ